MTPQNLMDYVKIYKNFISKEICKGACKSLKKINWEEHSFYSVRNEAEFKTENECSVSWDFFEESEEINKKIWFAINQYIVEDFKDFGWFNEWNGYSLARYQKYDKNSHMAIHCDHINTLFDGERKGIPTLTVLGSLNNNYKGGELVFFRDYKVELQEGDVMVFPSNFLYPHQVKPIISGCRYSFVSWVW